jgi:hypothetical protein
MLCEVQSRWTMRMAGDRTRSQISHISWGPELCLVRDTAADKNPFALCDTRELSSSSPPVALCVGPILCSTRIY